MFTGQTGVHSRNGFSISPKVTEKDTLFVFFICEKFHNNISNGFQLTEWAQVHGRNGYGQYKPELWFMCSACHRIVLYICIRFRENILNGIRVMEQTLMIDTLTDRRMYLLGTQC